MKQAIRIGVVYGGKSGEHEVSVSTAFSVINAIDKSRYEVFPFYVTPEGEWREGERISGALADPADLEAAFSSPRTPQIFSFKDKLDVVFPLIHGPNGEDGTLQGLLEMAGVPYVGSEVAGSALGMDKVLMKRMFSEAGLPQVDFLWYSKRKALGESEAVCAEIESRLGYPCFVKPANLGSSVGIKKAKDRASLLDALETACRHDRKIVVERFCKGKEIEVAILGNHAPEASVVGEIAPESEFYDFEAKYKSGSAQLFIPARVPESVSERVRELAAEAFLALDCCGLSRVDFFWEEESGNLFINEINTMPGFTPHSMYPMLWRASGLEYPRLIDRLVSLAFERHAEKLEIGR